MNPEGKEQEGPLQTPSQEPDQERLLSSQDLEQIYDMLLKLKGTEPTPTEVQELLAFNKIIDKQGNLFKEQLQKDKDEKNKDDPYKSWLKENSEIDEAGKIPSLTIPNVYGEVFLEGEGREMNIKETCTICFDIIAGHDDYLKTLKVFQCQTHIFCKFCLVQYLSDMINSRKVLDIKCPFEDCKQPIEESQLKGILPAFTYVKYTKFKRNALIERNPNNRWCPGKGCEQVLIGSNQNPKLECVCGVTTCFLCGSPWHEKKTCEEALEAEYKGYAKDKDVQLCPACKTRVEKQDGCNHMTCAVCTYEWCWLCRSEYSKGHFEAINPLGCPGLSSSHNTRKRWKWWKICLLRIAMLLLLLLGIALSPIWIPIVAMLVPNFMYNPPYYAKKCRVFSIRTILFIVGVAIFPLTIVVGIAAAIVPGTCLLGAYMIRSCQESARKRKRRKRLIKERDERIKQEEERTKYNKLNTSRKSEQHNYNKLDELREPLLQDEKDTIQIRIDI